ncbi:hypothetical protein ACQ4M4_24625 [Leptolyngbya sp. AN02str]
MNLFKIIGNAIRYIYDGAFEIFSPNRDHYPNTGVQPFEGDPYSESADR